MLYWPVQNIVVWGFFTVYLARDNHLQPGVVSFFLGAAILWGMFYAFQRDLATGFLEELWSRNLVNLFSTPLSISEYLTGLIIVTLLKAMIGMLAAGLTAWVCYAYNIFPQFAELIPFMLNLSLFALATGVMIIGLIVRYTTRIQTLAWSFAGLLMPFSCVFYPLSSLPEYLHPIAWVLPTTHSFEGMRQAIAGRGFSMLHFGWGITLDAIYYALAILIFHKMFESACSRGLLVKLE
jgi:ABC-2 type transport system permease protein